MLAALAERAGAGIVRHLMGRSVHDGRIVPEDVLGAVAVMDVEIDDRDPLGSVRSPGVARGDGGVIEEAEAHRGRDLRRDGREGASATKALRALPLITSSTAKTAPPAARSAASKVPGDIDVSGSTAVRPCFGVAARIASI